MINKKKVSVIISDVDDILIDFSENHSKATQKALDAISVVKGIEKRELERLLIHNAKWAGYAKNIAEVISDPIDEIAPKTKDEEVKFASILKDWRDNLKNAKIIEGVIITARKIKASGSLFILYSDYPESLLLLRLANVGFPIDLVDGVYAKPDERKATPITPAFKIKGAITDIKEKMVLNGGKMMVLDFQNNKEDVKFILKDIGCAKNSFDKTLLVANSAKFDFSEINNLGINTAGINQAKDPKSAPNITLDKGFVDINSHFSFGEYQKSEINLSHVLQGIKQR